MSVEEGDTESRLAVEAVAPAPVPAGVGEILRNGGPRLARDGFGPLAVFFAGWKLAGLVVGIAAAALFGAALFLRAQRRGEQAMILRLALVLVAIRAVVGLASGSARVYLAQEIGIDALLASAFFVSLRLRRPLIGILAAEFYPFTQEMLDSETFRETMARVTAAWGLYYVARGLVRTVALLTLGTDSFALVLGVTDLPFLLAMLVFSALYTTRQFRRSTRWGPLFAAVEQGR